jgi:uncharacterized protein
MRQTEIETRLARLRDILKEMSSVLVAYSGGADSTLLVSLSAEVLGEKALAVFADSPVCPPGEREEAERLAGEIGIRYRTIDGKQMENPEFISNTIERCYFCKNDLFRALKHIAAEEGLNWVVDGTNYDDAGDFRPGIRAAREAGIRCPLYEAGLTKDEVRWISHERGLPTWNKPASPCLASRIPYGTPITGNILQNIAKGERYLRSLGLHQLRLRHHGHIARIEVEAQDMTSIIKDDIRQEIVNRIKALGYRYVTLDLAGFRSGSLNEGIIHDEKGKR